MTQERKATGEQPDGPGEAVIDEPTAHALDPEADPSTEWERSAAEQTGSTDGGDPPETSGDEDAGPPDPNDTDDEDGDGNDQVDAETDVAEEHDAG
jgi:hypothetical protein